MPFFWVGGFGTGLLSVLARRGDARDRGPARTRAHARAPRSGSGSRCSAGGPTRPRPSPRTRRSPAADLSRAAARAASRRSCPTPRRAGPPARAARHDRVVRPVLRRPARPRPAAGQGGQLRPALRRRRGARRRPRHRRAWSPPGEVGEMQLRGPNLMRGICGRLRSDVFTVDGFYPTGDLGVDRRRRLPLLPGPARRHVQGEGRQRLPERGGGRAASTCPRSSGRSSSTSSHAGAPAVGRGRGAGPRRRVQRRAAHHRGPGPPERVQGARPLAGDRRDEVPTRATGKVNQPDPPDCSARADAHHGGDRYCGYRCGFLDE